MADDINASPLADIIELQNRLDFDLDDDPGLTRIANSALEDASDWARHYGSSAWVAPEVTPPLARKIILKACKRFMENPNGYTVSRAGDETLQWQDDADGLGEVEFDEDEIKTLGELAGKGRSRYFFGSATIVAYTDRPAVDLGFVPVAGPDGVPRSYPARPFPLFPSTDGPW